MTRNAGYTALLDANFPPAGGVPLGGLHLDRPAVRSGRRADRTTRLEPEFVLPAGADGAPFAGPFRWRAVVGFRATGAGAASPAIRSSATCSPGRSASTPPPRASTSAVSSDVSDLGVLAGRGTSAGQGETAVVVFPCRTSTAAASAPGPSRCPLRRIFRAAVSPTAASISVPANGSASPRCACPSRRHAAGQLPGDPHRVLAAASCGARTRPRSPSSTGSRPAIRVTRPSEGAVFARRRARPSRLRLRRPAQRHRPADLHRPGRHRRGLDTATPGEKTFRVTTTDAAGNTTVVTRRYRVLAPPPPERLELHPRLRLLPRDHLHPLHPPAGPGRPARRDPRGHLPRPLLPDPPPAAAPAGQPGSRSASDPARSPCAPGSAGRCGPGRSSR